MRASLALCNNSPLLLSFFVRDLYARIQKKLRAATWKKESRASALLCIYTHCTHAHAGADKEGVVPESAARAERERERGGRLASVYNRLSLPVVACIFFDPECTRRGREFDGRAPPDKVALILYFARIARDARASAAAILFLSFGASVLRALSFVLSFCQLGEYIRGMRMYSGVGGI